MPHVTIISVTFKIVFGHEHMFYKYMSTGLYPGILGMGPFSKTDWEQIWLFGNEISRGKLQNLGILQDFVIVIFDR